MRVVRCSEQKGARGGGGWCREHKGGPGSKGAGWEESDVDSGAETEMDDGSDATDLEAEFD